MKRDTQIRPRSDTISVIQQKIDAISSEGKLLARESGIASLEQKRLQDLRQNLLKETHKEFVQSTTPKNSIFISYSGVGRGLGEMACGLAREYGLHPKTGFDAEVELKSSGNLDIDESLPQAIMAHIISCDCFLGIWTEDFDSESKDGVDMRGNKIDRQKGSIPSVWMPFELGVAASHALPFRLLVASGTHRLYYEKPFQFQLQIVFEHHKFEDKAKRVIEYLANKIKHKKSHY